MKYFTKLAIFSILVVVMGFASLGMAQLPGAVEGTVTTNGQPVADLVMRFTDTQDDQNTFLVKTNAEGYFIWAAAPATYAVTLDTMNYWQEVIDPVEVKTLESTIVNIDLDPRPQDEKVFGTVMFDGQPIGSVKVYLLKVGSNNIDPEDLELGLSMFDADFQLVPYQTLTDLNGAFEDSVLEGTYFLHIRGNEEAGYLPYWRTDIDVEKGKPFDVGEIVLQKYRLITGTITNFDLFDFVMVWAYSINSGKPFLTYPLSQKAPLFDC